MHDADADATAGVGVYTARHQIHVCAAIDAAVKLQFVHADQAHKQIVRRSKGSNCQPCLEAVMNINNHHAHEHRQHPTI
jgi:hypothetical protein